MKEYRITIYDMRAARTDEKGAVRSMKEHRSVKVGPMKRTDAEKVLLATRAGLPKGYSAAMNAVF